MITENNKIFLGPVRRQSKCKKCGVVFHPHGDNPGIYCSLKCKYEFDRSRKEITRDWLYHHYIELGWDCPKIGKEVNRDPKSVWYWLKGFGIPTRSRGMGNGSKNTRTKKGEPGPWFGHKHTLEARQRMSRIAKNEGRVPYDPAIGSYMKGRKGDQVPSWKGGITPERQAFYSSVEWKEVVPLVWKRDNASCQICAKRSVRGQRFSFDIHHIVGFKCRQLRAELTNLVLLCETCHYWIHSKENTDKLFIKES